MKITASLLAAALATACGAQTLLGPIHYVSSADSPFDTASPSYVLENFEDNLFNVPGVSSNLGISVIGPGGLTDSVDADDGVINGNGTNGHSFFGNGQVGVTFTFDPVVLGGLPTQAGIVWTDGAGTTLFEAFAEGGASLGVVGPVAIADASFTGGTGEDHFFGIIYAGGIAAIKITNTAGGIEVDHFQFMLPSDCLATPDLNGDGQVDGADFGLLLAAWGRCGPGCCEEDLNGDGVVDGADLGLLLAAWG